MSAAPPKTPCHIQRIECPADAREHEILAASATAQQARNEGFNARVKPWTILCNRENVHYVARAEDGTICGWLVAEFTPFFI